MCPVSVHSAIVRVKHGMCPVLVHSALVRVEHGMCPVLVHSGLVRSNTVCVQYWCTVGLLGQIQYVSSIGGQGWGW